MTNWEHRFRPEKKKRSGRAVLIFFLILALIGASIAAGVYWAPERRAERAILEAQSEYEAGDKQAAVRHYEEALIADPRHQETILDLANVYLELGEAREAKPWLDEAALIDPLEPRYLDLLYSYAMQAEDYPLASSLLGSTEITNAEPDELSALIIGLLEAGLFSDAEAVIAEGLERHPNAPAFIRAQMDLLILREDVNNILSLYRNHQTVFNDNTSLLEYITEQQAKKLRWSDAADTTRALLDVDGETQDRLQDLYLYEARSYNVKGTIEAGQLLANHGYELPGSAPQIIGNTSGNLANGGFVATEGNRIYYLHHDDHSILATDQELASRTMILPESAAYLNAVDGWLYFRNNSRDGALYKVGTDGSDLMRLSQGEADLIGVWGAYIYYRAPDQDGRLFRCALDGTGTQAVTAQAITGWASDGSSVWITDADGIFKIEIEDIPVSALQTDRLAEPRRLTEGEFSYLNVSNEFVYYLRHLNSASEGVIERIALDGGMPEILTYDLQAEDLNYADGYLYFTQQTLHRISTSNLIWEKLGVSLTENIQITDRWLFARSPENDLPLVRLHPDGSNWGLLDDTLR